MKSNKRPQLAESVGKTNPVILNRMQLASYLGVGERTLRYWEEDGLIPVIRIRRRCLYRLDSILAALDRLES